MADTIASIMSEINKKFKEDLIHQGVSAYDYERIPFSSPRLNYITHGGLPIGKLIEFYGDAGSGKTSTALDAVANYQHMNGAKKVLYADIENTLDPVWATKLGVDVDDMIIFNPSTQGAETIFSFVTRLMDTGEVGLVVIDSIGVMMSDKAYSETTEDKHVGGISMALTDFSKRAIALCNRHRCTLIGINQERDVINSPYGAKKVTGGNAWQYNVSVRLDFSKGYCFDDKYTKVANTVENPAGNIVNVAMTKNKTCANNRKNGFYTLRYDIGIDYLYDLIDVCIKKYDNAIEQSGAWFILKNPETGETIKKLQGQYAVSDFLSDEANIDILKMYENFLDEKIKEE